MPKLKRVTNALENSTSILSAPHGAPELNAFIASAVALLCLEYDDDLNSRLLLKYVIEHDSCMRLHHQVLLYMCACTIKNYNYVWRTTIAKSVITAIVYVPPCMCSSERVHGAPAYIIEYHMQNTHYTVAITLTHASYTWPLHVQQRRAQERVPAYTIEFYDHV